jgi:ABC-type molybdate transport system ATPase subunit
MSIKLLKQLQKNCLRPIPAPILKQSVANKEVTRFDNPSILPLYNRSPLPIRRQVRGTVSYGISIARTILKDAPMILLDKDAPMILLDEATAALDPENELFIQRAINDLVQDKTVIAHRPNTIRQADKIAVIDQGHAVEAGTHEQLLTNAGLYTSLWKEQRCVKGWKL